MPVLLSVPNLHSDDDFFENNLVHPYKDDIWSYNDPTTNFAALPARWSGAAPASSWMKQKGAPSVVSRDSHDLKKMVQDLEVHGRVPELRGSHDERSHASSEETLLYPDYNVLFADAGTSARTEACDAQLEEIYTEFLAEDAGNEVGKGGVTLMLRDIPYRMEVEPHLFGLLRSTSDLRHVDYIYLPLTVTGYSEATSARNKGYCFIHFSNTASAQLFASRLADHAPSPQGKMMSASMAKFQGVGSNLQSLLDIHSKKWRPKNGHVYIRGSDRELTSFGLLRLRNLLKRQVASRSSEKWFHKQIKRRTDGLA
jgi:hypothetical protein